jgi:dTDP-4-dehydrorhamnose reductase
MKVLVTGSGGQLGQECVASFRAVGHNAVGYSSDGLDITSQKAVREVLKAEKPDVVVNCAAYTAVDQAESDPEAAFLVNRDGVRYLADICSEIDTILVHYSTDYVFPGKAEDRKKYPNGYPENAERIPVNTYGESKLAGELELEKSKAKWLLIRVSWLCSPVGNNFVNTMIRLGSERKKISVVMDQIGSPSYTFDVADKTLVLLEKGKKGVFHVSSEGAISWADFAGEIFHATGNDIEVERVPSSEYPTDAARPAFSLLSTEKIRSMGMHPLHWKKGLKKLLQLKKRMP